MVIYLNNSHEILYIIHLLHDGKIYSQPKKSYFPLTSADGNHEINI